MPRLGAIAQRERSRAVPHGTDGFWEIMLALDDQGPWTVRDVTDRTNAHEGSARNYVGRLLKAGIAVIVEEIPVRGVCPVRVLRLTRRPREAPRLKPDGTEFPEPASETLWRTMKMAKAFTARELVELASREERAVSLAYARSYLGHLQAAGIVAQSGARRARGEARYRLLRNTGKLAPKVLAKGHVYDPNAKALVERAGSERQA